MIKCVLFDLDGTLIDTEEYTISSKIIEGKKLGYDVNKEDVIASFGMSRETSRKHFASIYGDDFPYDELSKYRFIYIVNAMKENKVKLMPYAQEIISFLKENNILFGLCTSTDSSRVKVYQEYMPFLNNFKVIVSNDMVEHGKPSPDIYLKGMELIKVKPEETMVIEDAITGIKSGLSAGALPVMVPQYIQPDEFIFNHQVLVKKSLKEVMDYIKIVNNIVSKTK